MERARQIKFATEPDYIAQLQNASEKRSYRTVLNHAQMMACLEALAPLAGLDENMVDQTLIALDQAATDREIAMGADHQVVGRFWEVFDFLDIQYEGLLNHASKDGLIAVNLGEFEKRAYEQHQSLPPMEDIKAHLKTSQSRKFVDTKVVKSRHTQRTVRCWVFENKESTQ